MQLMLLDQQNKERLMRARQEQDSQQSDLRHGLLTPGATPPQVLPSQNQVLLA